MTKFADLGLRPAILRAVEESGYETMTPIQEKSIPILLDGKDLIGLAQTGTGKTAAFSLPIIQMLLQGEGQRKAKTTRALILAPTRELAVQIEENIRAYAKYLHYKINLVFGGVSQRPQIKAMEQGSDILIATPGRLLDLMQQGFLSLKDVEYFVLDEADRMLDMGFIRDIRKIVADLPDERQTIMFSATMPKSVEGLMKSILTDPERVEMAPESTTAEKVEQHVLLVPKNLKRKLLQWILMDDKISKALVFTRTKHGANRVTKMLDERGITSSAIHGNKSQNARQNALTNFKNGEIRVLVATDVAARGIDVDEVTHVINFDLPNEPESYVHRIGRTARAGASGVSLSFCDHDERAYLKDIERTIKQKISVMDDHPFHLEGVQEVGVFEGDDEGDRPARPARNRNRRSKPYRSEKRKRSDQSPSEKTKKTRRPKKKDSGQKKRTGIKKRANPHKNNKTSPKRRNSSAKQSRPKK